MTPINYDKYKGHTKDARTINKFQGFPTEYHVCHDKQKAPVGIFLTLTDAYLFADAPLILQRCMELERLLETEKEVSADLRSIADDLEEKNTELREVLQHFLNIAYEGAWDEEELMDRAHQALSRAEEGE